MDGGGYSGEPQVVSVSYDTAKRTCYCRGCGDDIDKGDLRVTVTTAAYYGDDEPGNLAEGTLIWRRDEEIQCRTS